MKTSSSKRVGGLGHFFFKSREEQRAFASATGKEKRDNGKESDSGRRWAVVA